MTRGFASTSAGTFAVDTGSFVRRAGGWTERYTMVRLPPPADGRPGVRTYLAMEEFHPTGWDAVFDRLRAEGDAQIAEFFRRHGPDPHGRQM